jgi:signal transduction histidine kinase
MNDTILLVDDEKGIRKVLGISLADSGFTVHTADSGQDALRIFRAVNPPIVLTDIKMPDMDGIELLRKIKQENAETEVIMLTGQGDMNLAIQSLKYDATDFVTKPIDDEILEIAIKRARERISLRRQIREYHRQLEKRVQQKAQQLIETERLAAVGQTITDLSQSITRISGGLEQGLVILGQGIESDRKQSVQDGWKMVKGNVDKIHNLSLDLLHYGKYAVVNYELCDPGLPVTEVVEKMQPRARKNHVELRAELSPGLKKYYFDPDGLLCCLENLVTNAIDACLAQDKSEAVKEVIVRTAKGAGRMVEYRVTDNGMGMPQKVRRKIFRSFFTTKDPCGTGIGLMMTKMIVDQHGGQIDVQSRKGTGTEVVIRLPARTEPGDGPDSSGLSV